MGRKFSINGHGLIGDTYIRTNNQDKTTRKGRQTNTNASNTNGVIDAKGFGLGKGKSEVDILNSSFGWD